LANLAIISALNSAQKRNFLLYYKRLCVYHVFLHPFGQPCEGLAFSKGMAAITIILAVIQPDAAMPFARVNGLSLSLHRTNPAETQVNADFSRFISANQFSQHPD